MRSTRPKSSRSAAGTLIRVLGLVGLGVAVIVLTRVGQTPRPGPAVAAGPAGAVTYFLTNTPAPPTTATSQARTRATRQAEQAATSIARATRQARQATATLPLPRAVPTPNPDAGIALAGAPTVTVPVCTENGGQIVRENVIGATLPHSIPVQIYLPPCFDATHNRYPTLYLIQGSGDIEGQWERVGLLGEADRRIMAGELPPFLIVMPDNDIEEGDVSIFMYTAEGPGSYEDYVVNDVLPLIERKYGAWQDVAGRAIGGISRGGYWAIEIAFRHPDLFGAVGGHSPAISSEFLNGTPEDFSMLMMASTIDALKTMRVWLDVGDEDTWTMRGPDELAQALVADGIPAQFKIGIGTHDNDYWSTEVNNYLDFYTAPWRGVAPIKLTR